MTLPLLADYAALSQEEMQALARKVAALLEPGDVVTLEGEVGSGKTTFAQALIGRLVPFATEVTSPTFTLMQPYDVVLQDGRKETLWHLDLYRLKAAQEAESLGLRELWDRVVLIEWPGIIESMLPEERLAIRFEFTPDMAHRTLHFCGNAAWRGRLERLR